MTGLLKCRPDGLLLLVLPLVSCDVNVSFSKGRAESGPKLPGRVPRRRLGCSQGRHPPWGPGPRPFCGILQSPQSSEWGRLAPGWRQGHPGVRGTSVQGTGRRGWWCRPLTEQVHSLQRTPGFDPPRRLPCACTSRSLQLVWGRRGGHAWQGFPPGQCPARPLLGSGRREEGSAQQDR